MRGGDCTSTQPQAQQTSKVGRLKQVREKGKSQPGREDHQAYRYSKGSEATEREEDRANATICLTQEAIRTAVETTSQVGDKAQEVRGGDGTATQPPAQPESNRGRPQHTSQRGIS